MTPVEYARTNLESRYQDLTQRIRSIEYSRRSSRSLTFDNGDRATKYVDDDILDRLADATQLELIQVRHAIERIDHCRYGVCEQCHHPIHPDRLRAIPEATTCSDCAMASLAA